MDTPLIRTLELGKAYAMGGAVVNALRGATLEIPAGAFTAIMGPSGSGKSTLMHLLGVLDQPSRGAYWLEGMEIANQDHDRRASIRCRKIGFVFQAMNLLPRSTAIENVELPLLYAGTGSEVRRACAERALDRVGLGHRRDHWPQQLSGGEQQRVAIARAIVSSPAIVLADEPTGSLDTGTGLEILALFQELNSVGMTVIVVTHDQMVADHASRIIQLLDGRVVGESLTAAPLDARAGIAEVERRAEIQGLQP